MLKALASKCSHGQQWFTFLVSSYFITEQGEKCMVWSHQHALGFALLCFFFLFKDNLEGNIYTHITAKSNSRGGLDLDKATGTFLAALLNEHHLTGMTDTSQGTR